MTESQFSEIENSTHARQLQQGFARLRFEPELEAEFMQYYWTNHRMRIRTGLIVGAIIFAVFSIKDFIVQPQKTWLWTVITVNGFIVPVLLIGALCTLSITYRPWITRFSHAILFFIWMGFVLALFQAQAMGTPTGYESILLAIAYILFATGLRAIPAVSSCIFGVVIYLIGTSYLGKSMAAVQNETFHLVSMIIIGSLGAYAREAMVRKLFLGQALASFRAEHDPLTQLLNRGAGMQRLKIAWTQAARQHNPIAILLIDADHFKNYNDQYGHLEGDKCLQYISKAIRDVLNRPMDMVARFGGEEFFALAYDTDRQGAEGLAEKIRDEIEKMRIPLENNRAGSITVSIGIISVRPVTGADALAITNSLRQADSALYTAKAGGRNRFVVMQ